MTHTNDSTNSNKTPHQEKPQIDKGKITIIVMVIIASITLTMAVNLL